VSPAERLLDSLRDLLSAWTYRLSARQSPSPRGPRGPRGSHVPRIDLHALVERHEARRIPTSANAATTRERVTMNDQAVCRLFERPDDTPSSRWPD
jgi:hypothetical protein